MAQRIRLSFDLMVPDDSPTTAKQYKNFVKEVEDYARVVVAPAAKIPFLKSGQPHFTVHSHNSTRRVSCQGCIDLSDDEKNNENG